MNEPAYRFGEFHLIPVRRELWRSGQRLTVQPKVFDTLVYLIQHRDRAVGRDELISAVWGRPDLTDNLLCQIVGRTRQLVGDTGEEQHSILTVPRFGYRWVRDVEMSSAEPEQVISPRPGPAKQWPRWAAATMALSVLCSVGFISQASKSGSHVETPIVATTIDARLANLRAALKHDRLDQARAIFLTFSDPDRARPDVRFEAAELAVKEGRYGDALNAYTALQADAGKNDALLAGKAAAGAGWSEFAQGQDHYPVAKQHYAHAIDLLRPLDGQEAQRALGQVWSRLGGLHTNLGEFDDATRAYAAARTALEGAGDGSALGGLENNIGLMFTYQFRYTDALPRLQRAADLCAKADDVTGELAARRNLVNLQLGMLQSAEALTSEPRLHELRDRLGDPVEASHLDLLRAGVLMANGRLSDAEVVLNALAGRPAPSDPQLAAVRDIVASELAFDRANWKEAAGHMQRALSSKWYASDSGLATLVRWRLIEALRELGDMPGLVKAAEASAEQGRANPDAPDIALYAALARGEAAAAQGDAAKAKAEFEQALAHADRNRSPYGSVQAYAAYTRFLVQHGDSTEARAIAERLDDWAKQDFTASLVQLNVYHAIGSTAWSAALVRTRRLAGERVIPAVLATPPSPVGASDTRMAATE